MTSLFGQNRALRAERNYLGSMDHLREPIAAVARLENAPEWAKEWQVGLSRWDRDPFLIPEYTAPDIEGAARRMEEQGLLAHARSFRQWTVLRAPVDEWKREMAEAMQADRVLSWESVYQAHHAGLLGKEECASLYEMPDRAAVWWPLGLPQAILGRILAVKHAERECWRAFDR